MIKWPGNAAEKQTSFGGLSRSELMKRIHSTGNATTELRMIKILREAHLNGWRRHIKIPGKPDFVWNKVKIALFIDGCFWHGHNCSRNLSPKTNEKEWTLKIKKNKIRDKKFNRILKQKDWIVIRIWECELKKNPEKVNKNIRKALFQNRGRF